MEQIPPPKEVKILETAEDIQERREQVLNRYEDFKQEARAKREKLEDSRRFQYFKRDADELESWIQEKLQAASDESYKDPTNLQVSAAKCGSFHQPNRNPGVSMELIQLQLGLPGVQIKLDIVKHFKCFPAKLNVSGLSSFC
ncbi:spectrin alpha chain-like [Choristoneura fumiferana]|uniref:spectrin alpha chain-like n=1 Tax=Choristoneura fumiferana TaxID=7141 RepID=UPI003D15C12B